MWHREKTKQITNRTTYFMQAADTTWFDRRKGCRRFLEVIRIWEDVGGKNLGVDGWSDRMKGAQFWIWMFGSWGIQVCMENKHIHADFNWPLIIMRPGQFVVWPLRFWTCISQNEVSGEAKLGPSCLCCHYKKQRWSELNSLTHSEVYIRKHIVTHGAHC